MDLSHLDPEEQRNAQKAATLLVRFMTLIDDHAEGMETLRLACTMMAVMATYGVTREMVEKCIPQTIEDPEGMAELQQLYIAHRHHSQSTVGIDQKFFDRLFHGDDNEQN